MNLDQKRMVVTGASSGIGRALLREFSGRPVQVVAVGRDEARLQAAIRSMSASRARLLSFTGDLARQSDADGLFEYAMEMMGGIDLFLANAGIAYWEWVQEPGWDRIEVIFKTNVFSPIYALEKMQELHGAGDYRVVITSSILGRVGLEGYALYSATKAALDRLAEVYRLETRKPGRLVLVYPLAVRSSFFHRAGRAPIPWLSQSAEVAARAIIRGLERDLKTIYTSWILPPMLLLNHLLPFARRWYQALDAKAARRHWATQGEGESQAR
jgi:NAD(P)-dependent dehydrogenase (short-subunit alcohol dehydrogenase family)